MKLFWDLKVRFLRTLLWISPERSQSQKWGGWSSFSSMPSERPVCVLSHHLGKSCCEQHAKFLVVCWRRLVLLTRANYEHLFPTSTWWRHVSGFKWAMLRVFAPRKLAELQITAFPTSLAPASLCPSGSWIQYSLLLSFEFVSNRAHLFVLQPLYPSQRSWSLQSHHCLFLFNS